MEEQFYIFDPATHTAKAPIPTTFEHLLKYVTRVEQYISLHSQEDIININNQLDQTTNLMISNIIQRVIAQIIGQTAAGFVTIKGSDDGALHVHVTGSEGSSQDVKYARISENTAASNVIIAAVTGKRLCICNLTFTVADEINITLQTNGSPISGAMDFGGPDEPRGMVAHLGDYPIKTLVGEAFKILMSAAVQVSGYCTYYECD